MSKAIPFFAVCASSLALVYGCAQLTLPVPPADPGTDGGSGGEGGTNTPRDGGPGTTEGGPGVDASGLSCSSLPAEGQINVPTAISGTVPFGDGGATLDLGAYEVTEVSYYTRPASGLPNGPINELPTVALTWTFDADGGFVQSERSAQGAQLTRSGSWSQDPPGRGGALNREFLCPQREEYDSFLLAREDGGYHVCVIPPDDKDFYGFCERWRRKGP